MACRRKALTSSYNHLSQRFHPSFLHILEDDRERSKPPALNPRSLLQEHYSSRPFDRFRSPAGDWRTGFSLTHGICRSSRNYSARAEGSSEILYVNDGVEAMSDSALGSDIATATASTIPAPFPGEVAAAAADSFLPVAALQHLIDTVHSFTGLNWWASIALTTLLIRSATVPLLVNQLKATMKLNEMRPEMEKLKEEMNNNMNPDTLQMNQKRMKELFNKHGVTPFTPLKGALIQGPVFISFFMAISNMVEKVPSFKGGGAFWFSDLTTPDAMYIFPVLTALTFLVTVELNMQEGMEGNPIAKTMKKFFRILGFMTVPLTAGFPKAIFCYWLTSNFFSLAYGFALKRPPVREFFNLPAIIPQANPSPLPNLSIFGGPKPVLPTPASLMPEKGPEESKPRDRKVSSSAFISQRIKNLEKTVKARNKYKKR